MSAQYCLTYSQDELSIQDENLGLALRVEKRGASKALGQLFTRRFVVFGVDGERLFQVIDGNSGTLPRASLKFDKCEVLVLTAGGGHFAVNCLVNDSDYTFSGDPFSAEFSVVIDGEALSDVSVKRGGGKAEYRFAVSDDTKAVQVLAVVSTLAVFRGRIIPCIESDE
ncbi:MAG: hypothetical protein Q4B77_02635 [Coriobacteriaceae bacterium]|nr:hypothetical protein [Coriobacteriaceae bacterium]